MASQSSLVGQHLGACAFLCLSLAVVSCSEVARQQPADLDKYPELTVLFDACGRFKSGSLDLDVGVFTAFFEPPRSSAAEFFTALDNQAVVDGWEVLAETPTKHVYKKHLRRLPQQQKKDTVWITFDSEREEVELIWK